MHTDLPPPIKTEPAKPRRVYIRNSVELPNMGTFLDVLAVKQRGPKSFRVTTRNSVGHESSQPCVKMLTSVHESGMRTEKIPRSVSDVEPHMKKVRFAEHTTVLVSPVVSTSHTQCLHMLRTVDHHRRQNRHK